MTTDYENADMKTAVGYVLACCEVILQKILHVCSPASSHIKNSCRQFILR
jgi:hypothetical protein